MADERRKHKNKESTLGDIKRDVKRKKISRANKISRIIISAIFLISVAATITVSLLRPDFPVIIQSMGADISGKWFSLTKDIFANIISVGSVYSLAMQVLKFAETKSTKGVKWETLFLTSISNVAFLEFALLDTSIALTVGSAARSALGIALIGQKYFYEKKGIPLHNIETPKEVPHTGKHIFYRYANPIILTALTALATVPLILGAFNLMPKLNLNKDFAETIGHTASMITKNLLVCLACSAAAFNMMPNIIHTHYTKKTKDLSKSMLGSQAAASIASPIFSIFTNSYPLFVLNCLRATVDMYAFLQFRMHRKQIDNSIKKDSIDNNNQDRELFIINNTELFVNEINEKTNTRIDINRKNIHSYC